MINTKLMNLLLLMLVVGLTFFTVSTLNTLIEKEQSLVDLKKDYIELRKAYDAVNVDKFYLTESIDSLEYVIYNQKKDFSTQLDSLNTIKDRYKLKSQTLQCKLDKVIPLTKESMRRMYLYKDYVKDLYILNSKQRTEITQLNREIDKLSIKIYKLKNKTAIK